MQVVPFNDYPIHLIAGKVGSDFQMAVVWQNPVGFDHQASHKIRVAWRTDGSYPADEAGGEGFHEITDGSEYWIHTGLTDSTTYHYSVFVYDGSAWDTGAQHNFPTQNGWAFGATINVTALDGSLSPLNNHIVTVTRVSNGTVLGSGSTNTQGQVGIYFDAFTAGESATSFVWEGSELTVLVEVTAGNTLYQKPVTLTGDMFAADSITLSVNNQSTVQLPATPSLTGITNTTSTSDTTPEFIWGHSIDPDNSPNAGKVHYAIELDTDVAFNTGNYRLYKSVGNGAPPTPGVSADIAQFKYALGPSFDTWLAFPNDGLGPVETGGAAARVKFTVPDGNPLSETTWKWRVYATDLTEA